MPRLWHNSCANGGWHDCKAPFGDGRKALAAILHAEVDARPVERALGYPGALRTSLHLAGFVPLAIRQLVAQPVGGDLAIRALVLTARGQQVVCARVAVS